jgi:hemoglobin
MSEAKTLYARLGGYDAISAVANNLVSRLMSDARLGRFWANRGEDGVRREIQLLIDFLCNAAGGPVLYTGRDMKVSHKGMRITEEDWAALLLHVNATLDNFQVPAAEKDAVVGFIQAPKQTSWKPKFTAAHHPDRPTSGHFLWPHFFRGPPTD